MIWHSGDYHAKHKNLLEGNYDGRRDKFSSITEMDNYIIDSTNQYVKTTDLFIYHGDFILPPIPKHDTYWYNQVFKEYLSRINCKAILFVSGNHDRTHLKSHG